MKRAEDRIEEILNGAERLFVQKGYDGTSVQEIIEAVGIAKGTFYHHFRSKLDLLDRLIERTTAQIEARVAEIVHHPDLDALARFRLLVSEANQLKLEHREVMLEALRVMYRPENTVWRDRLYRKSVAVVTPFFVEVIRQGVAEGVFNVQDPDATVPLLIAMGQAFNEAFAEAVLSNQVEEQAAHLRRMARAVEQGFERLLGAQGGTLQLHLDRIVQAWIEKLEPS